MFVVHRYGPGIAGGAERLCRDTAHALARAGHELVVLTTTADDVATWATVFPPGESADGDVQVRRFVASSPDPVKAARLLHRLALGRGWPYAEAAWVSMQGPVTFGLAWAAADATVDVIVFWTYLYATTQLVIGRVAGPSILVPAAHDEPMFRFGVTRGVFASAAGFAFLTPEERLLADEIHGLGGRPAEVVGTGLAPAPVGDPARLRRRYTGLPDRFALYLGRKDPGKGLVELADAHDRYRRAGGDLTLVLAGPDRWTSRPDWVRDLGYVDDETRADLLAAATVLVLPSRHESLSLVLAEAWQSGLPTLANGYAETSAGQTRRSGAGLLYVNADEYARQLRTLDSDAERAKDLGARGRAWAATQTWDAAIARWERLFAEVTNGPAAPRSQTS